MNDSLAGNEKIPLFNKWRHWYWLVILVLLLVTILFYLFTKHFS
jgi:Mg2+ and Co2+ transporter CorA